MEGCFLFQWGSLFFRWGGFIFKWGEGGAPWEALVLVGWFSKKIIRWGSGGAPHASASPTMGNAVAKNC